MSGPDLPAAVTEALRRWPDRFALVLLEEDGTVSWASEPVSDVLGYRPHEVTGRNAVELLHPDDLADAMAILSQNFERERDTGQSPELHFLLDLRLRHADGTWRTVEMSGVDLRREDGRMAVVLALRDFTQRRLLDDLLAAVAGGQPLDAVLGLAAEVAAYVVPSGRVAITATVDGRDVEVVAGARPPDRARRWEFPIGPEAGHGTIEVLTGQDRPHAYQQAWVRRVAQFAGIAVERAEHEARLRRLALVDPLTSVANRGELEQQLAAACDAGPLTFALVDLDRFKSLNDHHGHVAGDAYLVEVARRLRHQVRPADVVGRLGGDEFAVVCPGLGTLEDATRLAERLVAALAHPVHREGKLLDAGASIGVVVAPGGSRPDLVVQAADEQLYTVKRAGGGHASLVALAST